MQSDSESEQMDSTFEDLTLTHSDIELSSESSGEEYEEEEKEEANFYKWQRMESHEKNIHESSAKKFDSNLQFKNSRDPIDYFLQFFSEEIITKICFYSFQYQNSKHLNFKI